MKKFKFTISGNEYEAEILNVDENLAEVSINGNVYQVEVDRNMETTKTPRLVSAPTHISNSNDSLSATPKTANPAVPKGTGNVKSPLPGVILDVTVKEGDTVRAGQKLVMLEAMKMENNINADRDGKVLSVKVSKGDSVMEGDVLLVIGD